MDNKKIAQTSLAITIIILFSKCTGFIRDIALAYAYGTTIYSDAFVLAQSVVGIFTSILFISLGIAFIPVYSKFKLVENEYELNCFVNSTYTVVGFIVTFSCFLGIIGSDVIINLLAPGFSAEAHEIAVVLTKILMPTIILGFISTVQGQQLRGNNIFIPSACLAFPLNIILILAFIFLTPVWGINSAAYASITGAILQILMLYPFVKKIGYHFQFHFDIKNKGLREILILTLPITLGNAIQSIDTLVNRILASSLLEGSMAALNFSNKLAMFIVGIVSLGAGTVCYTKMAELGVQKDFNEFKRLLQRIINILNLIVIPASVGMMVLSVPIIRIVFEYGAFDSKSSEMTAMALWFYSIGLFGFVLREIISRAFYAINDATTPMINGVFAVGISIVANITLVRILGLGGLALATSISGIAGTVLLLVSLRRKLGRIGLKGISISFLKICISASIMGIVVHYLFSVFYSITGILSISLTLDIFCGILVYGLIIILMRIKEVDYIIYYLKQIISNTI